MKHTFLYMATGMLFMLLCLSFVPATALAQESEARQQLESTVNEVLKELQKPDMKSPDQRKVILNNIERVVERMFDFDAFAQRIAGRAWRNFTPEQKTRFQSAMKDLLREVYLEKLTGYSGERVIFQGEGPTSDGKGVEIRTAITVRDKPVSVAYRMRKKNRWVVYDVVIEDSISLAESYYSQFRDLLAKNDIEKLIVHVEGKAVEMKEFNKKAQAR